jgi:hypothetical protein
VIRLFRPIVIDQRHNRETKNPQTAMTDLRRFEAALLDPPIDRPLADPQ